MYVQGVEPLEWAMPTEAIALHLEELARGGIRRLLVNVPPGFAKSVLTEVLFPAWVWTWWPRCQFLCGSYSEEAALRDSVRCRAVVESEWYRDSYSGPAGWTLRSDQNVKSHFVNTAGGERFAVGRGGTGRRAHIVLVDDPLEREEARSKAAREEALLWIRETLTQRFVDARTGLMAMIMQRLHEEDPSEYVRQAGWQGLVLPTMFEENRRCVTYRTVGTNGSTRSEEFWRDPRTEEGQLLFPERFPREVVEQKRADLGEVGFAAQEQQRPSPAAGNLFRREDWRFWVPCDTGGEELAHLRVSRPTGCSDEAARELPARLDEVLISVDATFRETKDGSFVAIHVWGKSGARRLLLDRVKRRMDFSDTVRAMKDVIKNWPQAKKKVVEAKANGSAIISTLEREHGVSGLIPENPGTASKEERASAYLPYHRAHNIELPDGAPWLGEYVEEHATFPNGRYNDDVDAQSQALRHLEAPRSGAELMRQAYGR